MSALGFRVITAHDAQLQRARVATAVAAAAAAAGPAPPVPVKRPVGRPKRPHDPTSTLAPKEPALKKAKHTDWFTSPYINDILAEYKRCGYAARRTVERLRASAPDNRYSKLAHNTIMAWFDSAHQLLPHLQAKLQSTSTALDRGTGPVKVFVDAPEVEVEIKRLLLKMRVAGAAINSHMIRWVMRAVIEERCPALINLGYLTLSKTFVCRWAREQLGWRWRVKTTAASKLPGDWEEQGVRMAMRIGAHIGLHKVSNCNS
jgi:hypothetical protein